MYIYIHQNHLVLKACDTSNLCPILIFAHNYNGIYLLFIRYLEIMIFS